MSIQFNHITSAEGEQFVTVYADGILSPPAGSDHPNFKLIVGACEASLRGEPVDGAEVIRLFDVGETISHKFQQIGERVSVEGTTIFLDGDPVHGALQDQILDFVHAGEDFGPLVNFYEKLVTNPLGDVRDGLYSWIKGQKEAGTLTITPEGDVLGYKAVTEFVRPDGTTVYRPSRASDGGDRVNGVEVKSRCYIEQQPGDTVEMPRSKVLHAPSQACGDGLHIGTWKYASTFLGQDSPVLLVQFSPRDIVSLPDSASTWKLRVCRYKVVGVVDGPLDVPLYLTEDAQSDLEGQAADLILDGPLSEGDRVQDWEGDEGVLVIDPDAESGLSIQYDDNRFGNVPLDRDDTRNGTEGGITRVHGKGGPTSRAAKGRGRNPAQDAAGKFSAGRPGSARDGKTGRFVAA